MLPLGKGSQSNAPGRMPQTESACRMHPAQCLPLTRGAKAMPLIECPRPNASPLQGEPKQCRRPKAPDRKRLPNAPCPMPPLRKGSQSNATDRKHPTESSRPNAPSPMPPLGKGSQSDAPDRKQPAECTLPNASPCLRGGGTSGEAASDGRVRREKRRKGLRGETNIENTRPGKLRTVLFVMQNKAFTLSRSYRTR